MDVIDAPISFFRSNAPQDTQDSHDSHDLKRKTKNGNGYSLPLSREIVNLPLEDYVKMALEFCASLREEQSEDNWRSPLFDFARLCKAHRDITDLSNDKAMQTVEAVLNALGDLPTGIDPWEHYFPEGEYGEPLPGDEARVDFMTSWKSVRHVPFRDALQAALQLSEERPLVPPCQRGKLYARLVSLAGWLQHIRRDLTILLPGRTIGPLLSCNPKTVSRLCKLAIQDGLLRIEKESKFHPTGEREAREFRFAVERFPELRDEQ